VRPQPEQRLLKLPGLAVAVFAGFGPRSLASARLAAHCGWMPAGEYETLPQTGQLGRWGPIGTGVMGRTPVHKVVSGPPPGTLSHQPGETEPGDAAAASGKCRSSSDLWRKA